MRPLSTATLALLFACGASTTLPDDAPPTDASVDTGAEPTLSRGVLYDDCGPADGPAISGYVLTTSPSCDGSRTSEDVPRLQFYLPGSGPTYTIGGEGFESVSYCDATGCKDATSGTFTVDPPMGAATTVQVEFSFPTREPLTGSYIVALCDDDVLCG